jgi:hypothetical protein
VRRQRRAPLVPHPGPSPQLTCPVSPPPSPPPRQTAALQKVVAKFGVMEVCRTGRISLKRGEDLLENLRAAGEGGRAAR